MKFTLKDYQVDAVADVLGNLDKARRYWGSDRARSSFSLTATTGAGKTVVAAAVLEALFYGDENFDFEADPGATVIWFSYDPNLNEQTRFRLLEAADRLGSSLVVVQNTFRQEKFEPGKIHFLNTQKLSKTGLLVRGHEPNGNGDDRLFEVPPDERPYTIWETIQNSIDDQRLCLYLVLDEAHRGIGSSGRSAEDNRDTIVKRLINGNGSLSPIPVVWGISATVDKFNVAMRGAEKRTQWPNVEVDSARVQASGLLKDTIVLDFPKEVGAFDTVLLRRGTDKIKESTEAWAEYAKEQDEADAVVPLMVLQVPNTPDSREIGRALDTILDAWPGIGTESVAHVFGEHSPQQFGRHLVKYISPERVQESSWVRVLLAKDAISTGWDCPRAEVMVSFRPAQGDTNIAQLLGRMVRTPLARRIPGNERLNAVNCLLPFFNAATTEAIADELMKGEGSKDELPGRRVLIDAVEMTPNPSVPEAVWDKFVSLPSQSLPRRGLKPVKRLTALAQELASDNLLPDAGKLAHAELHKVLDAAAARYAGEIQEAAHRVITVEGETLVANLKDRSKSFAVFVEEANVEVIEDKYRRAARALGADLARTYAEYLAGQSQADSDEDALLDAHVRIAALGLVPEVKEALERDAESLASRWLQQYRAEVHGLLDERQAAYIQIREMAAGPQEIDLARPKNRLEPTRVRQANGEEKDLPTLRDHLVADADGNFPIEANDWERPVLDKEMSRQGFVAWYRNPSRSSESSLAIAYQDGSSSYRALRPDFVFFHERADGSIGASIVDPHSHHLGDALPKLRGLVEYVKEYGSHYQRVEAVAKVDNKLRVLDLIDQSVPQAIARATDAKELYSSAIACDY